MNNQSPSHYPLVIVGSGPAGYTAAVYAARAALTPVLFAGAQPGGQLMITGDVENYPGYPDGKHGPLMMEDFRKQAERFGTDIRYQQIVKVDLRATPKQLWTDEDQLITADTVIISTGASAKWLGLESETRLYGSGVSACAVCDGFFFKGKVVAIVGGGDTACEEALYLAKMCSTVHMLVRSDKMRASKIMQDRVRGTTNIVMHYNAQPQEVLGEMVVAGVRYLNPMTGETTQIDISGFFVAIGHKPNTDIFEGQLDMDENGYLVTQKGTTYTNLPGVFAAGDVQDSIYRQAVTAAGTGCMAALDAERWLAGHSKPVEAVHA
jgi:thioredoxin reductase (NADPH)